MQARWHIYSIFVLFGALLASAGTTQEASFTLEQVMSVPFPSA